MVQDLIMPAKNLEELDLQFLADEFHFLPEYRLGIVKNFIFEPRIVALRVPILVHYWDSISSKPFLSL